MEGGSSIIIDTESVHPLLSITLSEYMPEYKLDISSVVSLLLQRKLYGGVPPVIDISILPLFPWHVVTLFDEYDMLIWFGSEIFTESEITQPLSLVINTEYDPAQ